MFRQPHRIARLGGSLLGVEFCFAAGCELTWRQAAARSSFSCSRVLCRQRQGTQAGLRGSVRVVDFGPGKGMCYNAGFIHPNLSF